MVTGSSSSRPPGLPSAPDFLLVHDFENDKITLWNIAREDFWSGLVAPDLTAEFHEIGNGSGFYTYLSTRGVELWDFTDPGGLTW